MDHWHDVEEELYRFAQFIMGQSTHRPVPSFFISLTFPNIESSLNSLETVLEGSNAIELRIDLLESQDPEWVGKSISDLYFKDPKLHC